MSALIVVDDEHGDSAAPALEVTLAARGPVSTMLLSEFLVSTGAVYDAAHDTLSIDRAAPGRLDVTSTTIVNRVVKVSDLATTRVAGREHGLTPNFVFDAFADVLAEAPRVIGTPGINSPVGDFLPLNLQWHRIEHRADPLRVPTFVYAFGAELADTTAFETPIRKSPFDLYNWRDDRFQDGGMHAFVVEKPKGEAVIGYFILDAAASFALRDGYVVPDAVAARIPSILREVAFAFRAAMGEVLFFVDGEDVTFAAFSHYLKTASKAASFARVVHLGLDANDQLGDDAE